MDGRNSGQRDRMDRTEIDRDAWQRLPLARVPRRGPTRGKNAQLRAKLRSLVAFVYPDEDADALVQSIELAVAAARTAHTCNRTGECTTSSNAHCPSG